MTQLEEDKDELEWAPDDPAGSEEDYDYSVVGKVPYQASMFNAQTFPAVVKVG